MARSNISAVVFDMGNVLTHFDPDDVVKLFTDDPEEQDALIRLIFYSREWLLLDLGALTCDEAVQLWQRRKPKLSPIIRRISEHWFDYKQPVKPVNQLACVLKMKGCPIYLLSNTSSKFNLYRDRFPALRLMDGCVLSCEHHALKPDPRLYQILFTTYGLNPEECFLIDDLPQNIKTGRRLGMDGFVFPTDSSAGEAVRQIAALLNERGLDLDIKDILAYPLPC